MYYGFDATGIKYALKISIHKYCRRLCKPAYCVSGSKGDGNLFYYFIFVFFCIYLYYTIYI